MFFELREYRTKPGQRERWVKFMEEVILPFQISKGMVVIGSFVGTQEDDLYIWIRRFDSEEQREALVRRRLPERRMAERHRAANPGDDGPREDRRAADCADGEVGDTVNKFYEFSRCNGFYGSSAPILSGR